MNRRAWGAGVVLLLLAAAAWQGGGAALLVAKAWLAPLLIERAWQHSAVGTVAQPPWPWADSYPVARLAFPRQAVSRIVLSGASPRNLAFAPAHLSATPWPGAGSSTFIAGHRDTHFRVLRELSPGDPVVLERAGPPRTYRVSALDVVHEDAVGMLDGDITEGLMLVTCYPFDAINPGTPWRYVVTVTPVSAAAGE